MQDSVTYQRIYLFNFIKTEKINTTDFRKQILVPASVQDPLVRMGEGVFIYPPPVVNFLFLLTFHTKIERFFV